MDGTLMDASKTYNLTDDACLDNMVDKTNTMHIDDTVSNSNKFNSNNIKKYSKILSKSLIYGAIVFSAYMPTAIWLHNKKNENAVYVKPQKISELLALKQDDNSSLRNKKINLIFLEPGVLNPRVRGFKYSSQGEYNLVFHEDSISVPVFYHELGHILLSTKPRPEEISLEQNINRFNNSTLKNNSIIGRVNRWFYVSSPDEAFCNLYSIYNVKSNKDKF